MNRPTACVWAVFGDRLDFVAVEVFGRKNAVLVVIDLEQDDRRHQGASEIPGVALSEAEFVRHVFGSVVAGTIPRSTGARRVQPGPRSSRWRSRERRHALRSPTPQRVDRQGPGWNKGIKPKEREMGSAHEPSHLARNLADSCLRHLRLTYAGFIKV